MALIESIENRNLVEGKKHQKQMKKSRREQELAKLSGGKTTLKNLFSSTNTKANRITDLTRKI